MSYVTFYEIQKKRSFSERWWLTLSSEMGLDKTLNHDHSVPNIVYPLTFQRAFWIHSFSRICFMHIITSAALITNCAQNRQVFNSDIFLTLKLVFKNAIRRLLHLNGVQYNACQPHLLSEIPLRSPCIGRCQTHIQTSIWKY